MNWTGRTGLAVALAVGLLSAGAASLVGGATTAVAAESVSDLDRQGMDAINTWWGALVAGTPAAIGPVLAPEFQMMRADGSAYDKEGYLASSLPKIAAIPEVTKLVVTAQGDYLVTRYFVTVNETRDGQTLQRHAPRLTIFRKEGAAWLVVAHGNFATLEK